MPRHASPLACAPESIPTARWPSPMPATSAPIATAASWNSNPSLPLGVIAEAEYDRVDLSARSRRPPHLPLRRRCRGHQPAWRTLRLRAYPAGQQESARYIAQTAQRFGQTDDITVVSLYVVARARAAQSSKRSSEAEPCAQACTSRDRIICDIARFHAVESP